MCLSTSLWLALQIPGRVSAPDPNGDSQLAEDRGPIVIATVQAAFDQGSFVVFPLQDQIQHFIQIEENQLLRREAIIAAGGQDPGRPTYATSYGALAPVNSFDILFHPCFPDSSIHQTSTFTVYRTFPGVDNLHLPTMPALDLLLHPNMVIYAYAESRRPPLDQSDLVRSHRAI